ncbi:LysE family translocator [Pontiellaceae bacterium B12227]|nr:LysE family translocator [Pontiellaceae bacterium B12227]
MLDLETILTFLLAATLLSLAPGPDNIFVLTQSAVHGKSAGIFTSLGLCTGLMVHTLAVAFGVAAIFQASEAAFNALKLFGAGYLLYLAWQAFRTTDESLRGETGQRRTLRQLYVRGIIMNVTNPKVSIFFLAILPQFTDPARGPLFPQFLALGGLFFVAGMGVMIMIAFAAGALGEWLNKSPRAQSILHKAAGTVFVGLALKIATSHR